MMKFFKGLVVLLVIFLILFFISATLYVKVYGKALVEEVLTNALNRRVAFERASYHFPLGIRAQNIRIAQSLEGEKFFEAQSIITQLSPDAIYQGRLIFDSVVFVKPLIVIEKTKKSGDISDERARRYGVVIPPGNPDVSATGSASQGRENLNNNKRKEILVKQLILKQGQFQYTNSSIDKDFSFSMEDVYLKAEHLSFPLRAGQTDFNVSGRLVKKGNPLSGSSVDGDGWVDIVQRNMDAEVEIIEADGSVGMTAKAVSRNNDMDVQGEVKFQNMPKEKSDQDSSGSSSVNNLIFNALSSAGVNIGAKFSFKTKMDNFKPEQVSFSGNVVTK